MDENDISLEYEKPLCCPMDINDGIDESFGIVEEYESDNSDVPLPDEEN